MTSQVEACRVRYFRNVELYVYSGLFVGLNVLAVYVVHALGGSAWGRIWLPMHFFAVVTGLAFGWRCGAIVGLATPLLSFGISGFPVAAGLPEIAFKTAALGFVAGLVAERRLIGNVLSEAVIAVIGVQVVFGLAVSAWTGSLAAGFADLWRGYPGIMIQIAAGSFLAMHLRRAGN